MCKHVMTFKESLMSSLPGGKGPYAPPKARGLPKDSVTLLIQLVLAGLDGFCRKETCLLSCGLAREGGH